MKLSELRLTVKEVVSVCILVFALGGAAVSFNSMLGEIGALTKQVQKLNIEQQRINMIVNFLYAKSLKDGWTPPNWAGGPNIAEEGS